MESMFLLNYSSMKMFIPHSNILNYRNYWRVPLVLLLDWFCAFFLLLFLVVAELYSHVVTDTAERSGLHLPIPDWVVKEADAIVEHLLHSETRRAEVIHSNISDVV